MIVDRTFARKFFHQENTVGRHLRQEYVGRGSGRGYGVVIRRRIEHRFGAPNERGGHLYFLLRK